MAKSSRNKTIVLTPQEEKFYLDKCLSGSSSISFNSTINDDLFAVVDKIPRNSIDLVVVDPPYNLSKDFGTVKFKQTSDQPYYLYTKRWLEAIKPLMKKNASIYVCCDWKSTAQVYQALSELFYVRNRITWQREKGRGAKDNWKNGLEDIWYATVAKNDFYFDVDTVKVKRKVIAPYREKGVAKDWQEEDTGKYRLTYPSNFWDDITIPFWSMPENTQHPTQKPEKLIAKLILASSRPNDIVLDCFLGSGTTSVVAKKLDRQYIGIEVDPYYAALSEKRIDQANNNTRIQGYQDGVFWERNSQPKKVSKRNIVSAVYASQKLL